MLVKIITYSVLGVFFTLGSVNYSGYCLKEQRFLSKREFFVNAIKSGIGSISHTRVSTIYEDVKTKYPNLKNMNDNERSFIYTTYAKMFLKNNPDCCKVVTKDMMMLGEGWFYPTILGKILGTEAYLIEVKYIGMRQNKGRYPKIGLRHIYRVFGNCGKERKYF